ncbi:tellurium resistance protein [bacterium]|nr:tellurium resistance protein [bacterium]
MPADRRPPRFPPPQFPIRRAPLFANTPPVIFTAILGLFGLGLALRRACAFLGLPGDAVEVMLGAVLGLWAFAILALAVKVLRRMAVLAEDLRPLPGRAGLAAAAMSGMLAGGALVPHAPRLALVLVLAALCTEAILALLLLRVLVFAPEGRLVNPTWHHSFAGFLVAAPGLVELGWLGLAKAIFAFGFMAACLFWLMSLAQLARHVPPAPLRPFLAAHLWPAAMLAMTASLIGLPDLALVLAVASVLLLLALLIAHRWMLSAGFSPLWGELTFPLAATASALVEVGQNGHPLLADIGVALALVGAVAIVAIAWRILKLWPGGRLSVRTNAATA